MAVSAYATLSCNSLTKELDNQDMIMESHLAHIEASDEDASSFGKLPLTKHSLFYAQSALVMAQTQVK